MMSGYGGFNVGWPPQQQAQQPYAPQASPAPYAYAQPSQQQMAAQYPQQMQAMHPQVTQMLAQYMQQMPQQGHIPWWGGGNAYSPNPVAAGVGGQQMQHPIQVGGGGGMYPPTKPGFGGPSPIDRGNRPPPGGYPAKGTPNAPGYDAFGNPIPTPRYGDGQTHWHSEANGTKFPSLIMDPGYEVPMGVNRGSGMMGPGAYQAGFGNTNQSGFQSPNQPNQPGHHPMQPGGQASMPNMQGWGQ